jgi:hypothetical protein
MGGTLVLLPAGREEGIMNLISRLLYWMVSLRSVRNQPSNAAKHLRGGREPLDLSPGRFREMLMEALDDRATARRVASRLLLPNFPTQGGACSTVTSPGGTVGYVPYFDGACDIANSILFEDTANSRIGIGTASPAAPLHVAGNGYFSGNRQITLDTAGAVRIQGSTGGWALLLDFIGSGGTHAGGFGAYGTNDALTYYFIGPTYSSPYMVLKGGNVGVGTTSPLVKLDARGANAKATTADFQNIIEAASTDSSNPLTLRAGIKTDSTATNRYGAIEVDDAGTKRPLALQPSGGNVGVATTDPSVPCTSRAGTSFWSKIRQTAAGSH